MSVLLIVGTYPDGTRICLSQHGGPKAREHAKAQLRLFRRHLDSYASIEIENSLIVHDVVNQEDGRRAPDRRGRCKECKKQRYLRCRGVCDLCLHQARRRSMCGSCGGRAGAHARTCPKRGSHAAVS